MPQAAPLRCAVAVALWFLSVAPAAGGRRSLARDFAAAVAGDAQEVQPLPLKALAAAGVLANFPNAAHERPGAIGKHTAVEQLKSFTARLHGGGADPIDRDAALEEDDSSDDDDDRFPIIFMPMDMDSSTVWTRKPMDEDAWQPRVQEVMGTMERIGSVVWRFDPASQKNKIDVLKGPIKWKFDFKVEQSSVHCEIKTVEGGVEKTETTELSLHFIDGDFAGFGAEVPPKKPFVWSQRNNKDFEKTTSKHYLFRPILDGNGLLIDVSWIEGRSVQFRYSFAAMVSKER